MARYAATLPIVVAGCITLSSGCIALSARAHAGIAADDRGTGAEAGISIGFGYALEHEDGVLIGGGVATGAHAPLGVISTVDYARFTDHVGVRAGLGGTAAAVGTTSMLGLHVATLFPVLVHRGGESSEKSFSVATRTIYAGSLELWAGGITREVATSPPVDPPMHSMHVGGGASLGFEIISFERWH